MKKHAALLVVAFNILFQRTIWGQNTCPSKPDWYLKVEKPDTGWNLGIVDRGRKLGVADHTLSSDPAFKNVFVTEYALRGHYFPFTEVVVDSCEHLASLRTQHLKVEHAYGYSINGKTFAIVLSGNCGKLEKGEWIAAGCDTSITVMDTNGLGKFDSLRFGISRPDSVPSWTSQATRQPIVRE